MTHPLRIWLKQNKTSVTAFCEGAPFSYPTVYKLLKGEGTFSVDTIIDVAAQTNNEVTQQQLIDALYQQRSESAGVGA